MPDKEQNLINAWDDFYRNIYKIDELGSSVWGQFFRSDNTNFPKWKQSIVDRNRKFYIKNKAQIESWSKKYGGILESKRKVDKKFENHCKNSIKSLKKGILQIRASGLRVKLPNYFPTLVHKTSDIPIIYDKVYKKYRYITIKEAAKLQSFPADFHFPKEHKVALKQLGNAVNVKVIRTVAKDLLKQKRSINA